MHGALDWPQLKFKNESTLLHNLSCHKWLMGSGADKGVSAHSV